MGMMTDERREKLRAIEATIQKRRTAGAVYGLVKGLTVTMRTMLKPAITAQYPLVKPNLPPRTRGVIALKEENCTVCMLCSRECPDWCIYIDSHKDVAPPKTPGARARTRNVLDRFAIDYALCMYCGICVEVCPFDALFWSPHFEYSTTDVDELVHEMPQLAEWMAMVPAPPALDVGSDDPLELAAEDKAHNTPEATEPAAAATPAVAPAAQEPLSPSSTTAGSAPDTDTDIAEAVTTEGSAPETDTDTAEAATTEGPAPEADADTAEAATTEGSTPEAADATEVVAPGAGSAVVEEDFKGSQSSATTAEPATPASPTETHEAEEGLS